jgi:hypothetical protein
MSDVSEIFLVTGIRRTASTGSRAPTKPLPEEK